MLRWNFRAVRFGANKDFKQPVARRGAWHRFEIKRRRLAVRYLKEVKLWGNEMEKKQQRLLQEQSLLKKVWDEALAEATSKGIKEQDFTEFWDKKRAAAFK